MEGTNIYISDTDDQKMRKVLSSISSVIFREKKYDEILLKTIPIWYLTPFHFLWDVDDNNNF